MGTFYKSILKKLWVTAAVLIIFAAVFSSLFRALTPFAKQYKGEVEHHLSVLIGQPVTIQTMQTSWYWFQPVLKLDNVAINEGDSQALHLEKLLVGINLFKSLWDWQIQPGVLVIDDITLVLRQKQEHWSIDGVSSGSIDSTDLTPAKTQHIIAWLAKQQRLVMRHVALRLHFADGELIPISGLNVSVHNGGGTYKIRGEAKLDQTSATSFVLLGDVRFNPYNLDQTQGHFYLAAKHLVPSQWQMFIPKGTHRLQGGVADLAVWLDLNKGLISSVQAQVQLNHFAVQFPQNKTSQFIQSFFANLSWHAQDKGWRLQADNMRLRIGGIDWPENKLLVSFDEEQQAYQVYVKSIVLESLLAEAIDWPKSWDKVIQLQAQGRLSDTQVFFKEQQLTSVLTRFDHLSWQASGSIPEVHNLSGVFSWQPNVGHLELDSENSDIQVKGYPKQKFTLLNAALEWKELNNGVRLSIDRLLIKEKDFTFSAEGAVDQVTRDGLGHIRINANYAGENNQQLLSLLPKEYMKPKLYAWFTKNIKRVAKGTASLTVNGFAKDFPFDSAPGEFTLTAHGTGIDLYTSLQWPMFKDIEGYLKIDKRNMNIDVVNGNVRGIPLKNINLRLDDIGKNKETLLVHVVTSGVGQTMINYLLASPLATKLADLKMLTLKGLLALNMRMEVPLYPENDDVYVKGDVRLNHNTATFMHHIGAIELENLTGSLSFDEKGVYDSAMMANILGDPMHIKLQTVSSPESYTAIQVYGTRSANALKNHFNLPIFSYLKGAFYMNAAFKLTDDPNDFDSVEVTSNLQGLAIDLPEPLGKAQEDKRPLRVSIAFNSVKGARIKANYNNQISSEMKFSDKSVESIAVRIGTLSLLNQNLDNLSIKAKVLADNNWSFKVDQKNIAGTVIYQPDTYSISGHVQRMHLSQMPDSSLPSNIHPLDIPNLNVRIDTLNYGDKQIGAVNLKTKSTPEQLLIENCRIDSPVYQFVVQGDWAQKDNNNKTKVHIRAHLNDVAKSVQRWGLTPALTAGKGDIEFKGSWNNSLFDFSFASLNGAMYLKLKKGIITHLSQETEGKLGIGKLLSILSLQTIPRRLQLDFSDLSHDGYSFDIFKGNFTVKNGIMNTQDSYLDGPVAYAAMKGDLDLVRQLYDMDLKISPHITASLPVVATIAGGPIAGLAAWVANKIINQGMQKIIAYTYKVSGPWSQPVVQQVSIVKQVTEQNDETEQFVDETEYENQ